jgi:DNA-binding transcriptional MerR regulator
MSFFNIHIASQLSGVAAATIRAWEKRYTVLTPHRADNGHRLYSEPDIEKLSILNLLTQAGIPIGKIAKLDVAELKDVLRNETRHDPAELFLQRRSENVDSEKLRTSILLALSLYKLDIISHELDKAKKLLGPRDFVFEMILPLFREIGIRVYSNKLSIGQEHTLSAIVQFHMGQMIAIHYTRQQFRPGLIILAAPEGELHEIGLLAAALLCVEYGVKFIFLGKDLPVESLIETIQQMEPSYVLLGVTKGQQLTPEQTLGHYLTKLKAGIGPKIQVSVGGNVEAQAQPELKRLGVTYLPTLELLDKQFKEFLK